MKARIVLIVGMLTFVCGSTEAQIIQGKPSLKRPSIEVPVAPVTKEPTLPPAARRTEEKGKAPSTEPIKEITIELATADEVAALKWRLHSAEAELRRIGKTQNEEWRYWRKHKRERNNDQDALNSRLYRDEIRIRRLRIYVTLEAAVIILLLAFTVVNIITFARFYREGLRAVSGRTSRRFRAIYRRVFEENRSA